MAPAAHKMSRLVRATLAFMVVTIITFLTALFIVGKLLGNPNPTDSLSLLHKGYTHTSCSQKGQSISSLRPKEALSWDPTKATVKGELSKSRGP